MTHDATCRACHFPVETGSCPDDCDHRTHCSCVEPERPGEIEKRFVSTVDGLDVRRHAVERWHERTSTALPPCPIEDAWQLAVSVGSRDHPDFMTFRLYSPENLLFLTFGGELRTALPADDYELTTDHLVRCEHCDEWLDPGEGDCPWCDGPEKTGLSVSNVGESPHEPGADDLEQHECPGCGTETFGTKADPRCKICRLADDGDASTQSSGPSTCLTCGRGGLEASQQYCEDHRYLAGGDFVDV